MVRVALLACSIFACITLANGPTAGSAGQLAQSAEQRIDADPLLIFIAEGPPNSCGPGCSRWIAVEGNFNRGAAQRVRTFLAHGTNRNLPVYFHSKGGWIDEGLKTGELLRELRMTAGVGRTSLQGCAGVATSKDCRRLVAKGEDRQARLRFAEGSCVSSCAIALLGASRRIVDAPARLGIHRPGRAISRGVGAKIKADPAVVAAALRSTEERTRRELLEYTARMGIDPALVELIYASAASPIRYLTRSEIDRFGVLNKPLYETPWVGRDETPTAGYTLFKTVSRKAPAADEQLTTMLGLTCYRHDRVTVFIEREMAEGEAGNEPVIRVVGDDMVVWVSGKRMSWKDQLDYRYQVMPFEEVLKVVPKRSFELKLEYTSPTWTSRSETIKLSIAGLEKSLLAMRKHCEKFQ
ncbi:MAG TPA: hypothetical protein VFY21_06645 [Xanthobacteraceae bacterium]|nr:hypothetical protein [Xanthobacteraceae bacterium]